MHDMNETRILLADDEEALRELLREQLSAQGYAIDEAQDGVEAVEKLQQNSYHLAILDINMPRKNGLDVLRHIREQNLPVRVIMLTGRLGFSVGSESMLLGADEYITKPFDLDYLEMAIKKVLAKSS
jgi:DNA-binding response OmpR family regulator